MKFSSLISLILLLSLSACSTRGPIDAYDGSTGQRLVTYSIDSLMKQLPAEDFEELAGQKVMLNTHFIAESTVLEYATARLQFELKDRFKIQLVGDASKADTILDVFFTSLGTDKDTWGLSIPIFWVDSEEEASLDLLAVKMFHGVSELYYYATDVASGEITYSKRWLNRSKADVFSTPLFSFPVDHLDEASITD